MALPTVTCDQLRAMPKARVVDLRSPAEFERDHLPGAVNVPLFDDAQRALVGTLYKQSSQHDALQQGLAFTESRLPELLSAALGRPVGEDDWRERYLAIAASLRDGRESFAETAPASDDSLPSEPLVLHCWRGGLRSRSVVALLQAMGEQQVLLLDGGYKAWRQWVRDRLAAFDPATHLIVLRGPTGVGKTRILQSLEASAPGSTIDLEGHARHRSSVLGGVGLRPASTLAFETGLAVRLDEMGPPPWFVEGESRKVGDVIVPAPLFAAMEAGTQVRIDAGLEHRVALLGDEYLADSANQAEIAAQLPFLEKRLGAKWTGRLQQQLEEGDWQSVAATLLERYYDVRYSRSDSRRIWAGHFRAEDPKLIGHLLELRSHPPQRPAEVDTLSCADSSA